MCRALPAAALLVCALAAAVAAQPPRDPAGIGGAPSYPTRTGPSPIRDTIRNSALTPGEQSLEGQVVRVSAADNLLVVEQKKTGKLYNIRLDQATKLKADKQTELAGREGLGVADFKPGQTVRITYAFPGPKVLEVRLRRKKG